jgi:hypothetical protein
MITTLWVVFYLYELLIRQNNNCVWYISKINYIALSYIICIIYLVFNFLYIIMPSKSSNKFNNSERYREKMRKAWAVESYTDAVNRSKKKNLILRFGRPTHLFDVPLMTLNWLALRKRIDIKFEIMFISNI